MTAIFSHKLTKRLADVRKQKILNFLRPDGKAQVTIEYKNRKASRVDTVVVSSQHVPEVSYETLREAIIEEVIKKALPADMLDAKTKFLVNPTGRFVVGGPMGDCGLTGRKIIVDTYGGHGSHGGGCFSGKDPSKVDRSASYMGRYVAKNIVAAGLAKECEVQVAYAIGYPEPVSILVDTMGTNTIPEEQIEAIVRDVFDLRPAAIIQTLDLLRPIYKATAAYGHFGRTDGFGFTWENTDKVEIIRSKAGL